MPTFATRLALILFLAACLPPSASTAAAPAGGVPEEVIPAGLGVNIHFTAETTPGELAQLAASGVKFIRMDFDWAAIEKERGAYDFSAYDRLLDALDRHGLRALLILDYCNPHYDDNQSPHTDDGRAGFARWAAAAAARYKGRGVVWEMYNEPNISPQWRPTVNVQDYIALAAAVGEAVHEADPDAVFVGPAVAGIDFEFMEPCFEAGLLEHFDAVAVHPYGQQNPEEHEEDLRALRRMIAHYAPPEKRDMPILCTEWGYSGIWIGFSRERQAKVLPRMWLFNLSHGMPMSVWYNWRDNGLDPKESEHHFGFVEHAVVGGPDGPFKTKPAYHAAATFVSQLDGYRFNKRLWTGDARDWVLIFSRGDEVKLAVWTTADESRQVEIPASTGEFSVVSHLGEALPALASASGRLTLTATDAPLYLAPTAANDVLRLAAAWPRAPAELSASAKDLFAHAEWDVSFRNPLASPVQFQYVRPAPPADAVEDERVRAEPGAPVLLRARLPMTRLGKPQPTVVTLGVDGIAELSQRLVLACANPWSINVRPLSPTQLRVDVENPSREEGWGRAEILDAAAVEGDAAPPLHAQAIGLSEGQVRQWMFVSTPPRGEHHIAVRLSGAPGERLDLPPERFVPIDLSPEKWKLTPEGDPNVASTHSISAAPPPGHPLADDTPAAKVAYAFDEGWKYVMLQPAGGPTPIQGEPHAIGLWVRGDGSGNFLRCRFRDASGQTFQPEGVRMSFHGWQYVEFPLSGMKAGYWGGDLTGRVRYPIELDTLLLIDSGAKLKTGGEPTIAMPVFIYRQW